MGSSPTLEVDAAFENGSVDQLWQSHMLEVHDSMGSNPIGTTRSIIDCVWKMKFLISFIADFPLIAIGLMGIAIILR